jgi:hypothetical protein
MRKSVVLANGTTRLQIDITKSAGVEFDMLLSSELLGMTKVCTPSGEDMSNRYPVVSGSLIPSLTDHKEVRKPLLTLSADITPARSSSL